MNIISTDNLNFKAKLNIRQVKDNKCRWRNIAGIFEKETKTYPKDVFGICGGLDEDWLMGIQEEKNLYCWLFGTFNKNGITELLKLSDNIIARKLVSVFLFLKHKEKIILSAEQDTKDYAENSLIEAYTRVNRIKNLLIGKDILLKNNLKIW